MLASELVPLLTRTAISLAIVLAIVAVAYAIAKRRVVGGKSGGRTPRSGGGRRRSAQQPIEVVGRAGITRSNSVVAVRFGDRVVLVCSSEQGTPSVLAEMPVGEWDDLQTIREPIATNPAESAAGDIVHAPRPSFLEALRQATTRRA